eukprot:4264231-Pyramimonas_sp.AAC.1
MRGRKNRAEPKRSAGKADRAAERLELERKWHEKHDAELQEGDYVPTDGLKGHVEEDFITSEVVLDSDGKEVEVARSTARDDTADEM